MHGSLKQKCLRIFLYTVNSFMNPCSSATGNALSASAYLLITNSYCLFLSITLAPLSSHIGDRFAWCSIMQVLTPSKLRRVCFRSCSAPTAHYAGPDFLGGKFCCWAQHLPWRYQTFSGLQPKPHSQPAAAWPAVWTSLVALGLCQLPGWKAPWLVPWSRVVHQMVT